MDATNYTNESQLVGMLVAFGIGATPDNVGPLRPEHFRDPGCAKLFEWLVENQRHAGFGRIYDHFRQQAVAGKPRAKLAVRIVEQAPDVDDVGDAIEMLVAQIRGRNAPPPKPPPPAAPPPTVEPAAKRPRNEAPPPSPQAAPEVDGAPFTAVKSTETRARWYEQMYEDLATRKIKPADYVVGVAIGHHVEKGTGKTFPGLVALAKETGLSVRRVQTAIDTLVAHGHLKEERSRFKGFIPLLRRR